MFKKIFAIAALMFGFAMTSMASETITVYPAVNGVDSNGQIFYVDEGNIPSGHLTTFLFEEEIYLGPTVGIEYQNVVAGSVFANPDWKSTVINTPALVVNANGKMVPGYKGTVHATWSNKVVDGTYIYYSTGRATAFDWITLTVTIN